jgi:hypothetical protein
MLYREIIAVCSEIHTKHINTLCGQNAEFVNVKPGGIYSNHWALKGSGTWMFISVFTTACHRSVFWAQWIQFISLTLTTSKVLSFFIRLSNEMRITFVEQTVVYFHALYRSPDLSVPTAAAELPESESLQSATCGRRLAEEFAGCDVNITKKVYSATASCIGTAHSGYTLTHNLKQSPVNLALYQINRTHWRSHFRSSHRILVRVVWWYEVKNCDCLVTFSGMALGTVTFALTRRDNCEVNRRVFIACSEDFTLIIYMLMLLSVTCKYPVRTAQ